MPTPTRRRRLSADHFRALAAVGLRTPIGTDRRKVEAMLTEAG
jgi:hypothetical protein